MNDEIHLVDFPINTYILLEKNFLSRMIKKAMLDQGCYNFNQLAKILNRKSVQYALKESKFSVGDIKLWLQGERLDLRTNKIHLKCMPLWVLIEFAQLSDTKLEDIEKKVILYRAGGSGNTVSSPEIPIKINPEFESILIHLLTDGYAGDFTPSYCQYERKARDMFTKKLKNCFGNFKEGTSVYKSIRFPKIITDIITKYYGLSSYHTFESQIPAKIFSSDKLNKLACIVAFIQDEGNIRDMVTLTSANHLLLSQIHTLIQDCGYNCNPIIHRKSGEAYDFSISNKCINQFISDIKILKESYPTCGLFKKMIYLEAISNRKGWRLKDNILQEIVMAIINQEMVTKDVAVAVGCSYTIARRKLNLLLKDGKVSQRKVDNVYYWRSKE